ncbi:fatty acyl-CoA reductase wat-like [Hyposmocoma kahamanoa]|uniref:fatty acyl-CoA reductase wat-like n=1 Tax=Hyposmocoma kahamanoa TaxID=1477025 RepID=UPI000E6D5D19|nr:fatty acyl-CoA reductase wat-like [Hyposmocoma kahamanoa]
MDPALALEVAALSKQRAIIDAIEKGGSGVQQFYNGAVVFVTGGSGFLGKQLIEKLLRSCDVKKIFVLLREKKGKTMEARLEEFLEDPVFELLCKKKPSFSNKLHAIAGDIMELKLGISEDDWSIITKEINVILHIAATTRFDESLKVATITNVRGTREALNLGKSCQNLKSFVHVSTAYSHATVSRVRREVADDFYDVPVPPNVLIEMVEHIDEGRLNDATNKFIGDWPNTYCFTKAVAEEAVRTMSDGLPVCIVRPAIVVGAYREPSPGWIDMSCAYGPSGLILGVGLGLLHTNFADPKIQVDLVPADLVNNAILVAAHQTAHANGEKKIYTVCSARNSITWGAIGDIYRNEARSLSSPKAVWYCYGIDVPNKWLFTIMFWLLHYIPAYVIDGVCLCIGQNRRFVKLYTKAYKMFDFFSYFTTHEWRFKDGNTQEMIQRSSESDRAIFNCDITSLHWKEYILIWSMGLRKYIVKDGLTGTDYAVKKQHFFFVLNLIVTALYAYFWWSLFSFINSAVRYVL